MSIKNCEITNRRITFLEIELIFIKAGNEQRNVLLKKKISFSNFYEVIINS
jgi:hypothetical protein